MVMQGMNEAWDINYSWRVEWNDDKDFYLIVIVIAMIVFVAIVEYGCAIPKGKDESVLWYTPIALIRHTSCVSLSHTHWTLTTMTTMIYPKKDLNDSNYIVGVYRSPFDKSVVPSLCPPPSIKAFGEPGWF